MLPAGVDLPNLIRELELGTDEGKVNVVVLVLVAAGFAVPPLLQMLSAALDRALFALMYLFRGSVPPRFTLRAFTGANVFREAAVVVLIGCLCIGSLVAIHNP